MSRPKGIFTISKIKNASGTESWRVTGTKVDGTRVRKHFHGPNARPQAMAEKGVLEIEALNQDNPESMRLTSLTAHQLRTAEVALTRVTVEDLLPAVDFWRNHLAQEAAKGSVTVRAAFEAFRKWLDRTTELRAHSKRNLGSRIERFADTVASLPLTDITPAHIEQFLDGRDLSPVAADNDRRAISRLFSWCIAPPRRWLRINPASGVHIEKNKKAPPAILTVDQCETLLRAAEARKGGRLVPYVVLCLFAGLRPEGEAKRVTWGQINLKDREIRLEAGDTKTDQPRVFEIVPMLRQAKETHAGPDTLLRWLKAYKQHPVYTPKNWRRDFIALKRSIGYGKPSKMWPDLKPWTPDILRHTAISHYLRLTGSYGQTAEQFGNSEGIIKARYQGRVTSEDTKAFYAILPTVKKKAKGNIIELKTAVNE